jgi:GTP cyclohydrolase II
MYERDRTKIMASISPNHESRLRPAADTSVGTRVEISGTADLPSQYGAFRVYVFSNNRDTKEHVAMVHGDVFGAHDVPTRVHSECLTGDVLGSLRCDCRPQLERALERIGALARGVLLYMRQEGRGVRSIALMTNNPDKVKKLEADGIVVRSRIPHEIEPNPHNRAYLQTKAERFGHFIDVPRK